MKRHDVDACVADELLGKDPIYGREWSLFYVKREIMVRTIIVVAFLALAAATNSYAQDTGRIAQLEREVQELKVRVTKLESLLNSSNSAGKPVALNEGWKSPANWRKLAEDMSMSDVRAVLGDPKREDNHTITFWIYPNDAQVTFISGKLRSWKEPQPEHVH